ncbi:MAG: NADH-quinone oxidoreductase subunit A [Planctomycetes bacterium]|nr:NADH-quinone oxidoreductase subunit A [Planctomycetota bacterium]MBU4400686.1 NADH-quinone oxidoreductase subunit A [Planctomycetota bacterium]MCG2683783.1 NADH-quinone oxidoreductase subunit A [Planctomycetales bacterium]
MSPTVIVAYLALFATVGFLFVFACLLLGKFLRAHAPTAQKLETYECGEPAVGPGSVQFDLRFYVVALLFLIFEVEVVLFFPPATVFGQATRLLARERAVQSDVGDQAGGAVIEASNRPAAGVVRGNESTAYTLALVSLIDMGVFFAVLLVGFAFLWRRGDLDWVRAVRHPTTPGETVALAARPHRGDYRR